MKIKWYKDKQLMNVNQKNKVTWLTYPAFENRTWLQYPSGRSKPGDL